MDLGLERAGMTCKWQVEIDPFCQKILTKHWPEVPKYGDIRDVTGDQLGHVDCIAGGFPCQDVSQIGKREGMGGGRSGLWVEYKRIICELRPRVIIVENVSGLLHGGIADVLGDLAEIGFDAEWEVLPAAAFGAPQLRERVFIVAYARGKRLQGVFQTWAAERATRRSGGEPSSVGELPMLRGISVPDPYGTCLRLRMPTDRGVVERPLHGKGAWSTSPGIFRVATRVPGRVDRLRGLGNAVVPQVAEWVGRRIMGVKV